MTTPHFNQLLTYVKRRYPQFHKGISEAATTCPEQFSKIAEMYLGWLKSAGGENAIEYSVDAYVQFTTEVNLAQARYEVHGHYEHSSFAEVNRIHYSQDGQMQGYLWGVFLTNFLWAHHVEICQFFSDRFLTRLATDAQLIEIAPGHGGWGVWALHTLTHARLSAYDISPSSIAIASSVAKAAGVADRAQYVEKDALDLSELQPHSADAGICSFLIEHLETPEKLLANIYYLLKPGGIFFVTGALTAAQIDHIYEFKRESELVKMAEDSGLRVLETLSTNPKRLLPRANFIPRSMALLIEKPLGST